MLVVTGCGVTQFLIPFRQVLEIQAFMVMTCTWNRVVLTADGLAARCACRQPLPAVPRPPEYLQRNRGIVVLCCGRVTCVTKLLNDTSQKLLTQQHVLDTAGL